MSCRNPVFESGGGFGRNRQLTLALGLVMGFFVLVEADRAETERETSSSKERFFAEPLDLIPKQRDPVVPVRVEGALDPTAILLLTLDTTRADHLGSYGYDKPTSPALDRLASEGIRASHAVSPMPTTDPAHLSMFTGLFPRTHGVIQNGVKLAPGTPSLSNWARNKGYRTAAFVTRVHVNPADMNLAGFEKEKGPSQDEKVRDGRYALEDALDWLDENGHEPFFLWLHLFDPHKPYRPHREYSDRWVHKELQFESRRRDKETGGYSAKQIQANVSRYDAEINYMDGLVEEIVTRVRAYRVEEESPLIIVAGDHGEILGELLPRSSFAFGHGKMLYSGATHVPLFFIWPGKIPSGVAIKGPVQLTDIAPTVFDLVGDPGFPTQGTSLVPYFEENHGPARVAISQRRFLKPKVLKEKGLRGLTQYAIEDGRYMLIVSLPEEHLELLDLRDDPATAPDRSEELPEVRDRLRLALQKWMKEVPPAEETGMDIPDEKIEALRALGYIQ